MSASKVDLAQILECKICLDTYHKPKQLTCGHSYCQDCLDSILVFNNDGSAALPCPLRCNRKTLVNQHETTSSLVTAYTLNDLLDQIGVKRKDMQEAGKKYTFGDVMEIIRNSDVKKLQTVLIDDPTIVEMRGGYAKTTLLMEATRYNNPLIIQYLIDAGSDVYAVDEYKQNAYHYSARYGYHDALKVLINHDVTNINIGDAWNNTPLHLASRFGHIECVKLLLSVPHIDVNIRNNRGKTAYDLAGNDTIKRLLQEHGKNN